MAPGPAREGANQSLAPGGGKHRKGEGGGGPSKPGRGPRGQASQGEASGAHLQSGLRECFAAFQNGGSPP